MVKLNEGTEDPSSSRRNVLFSSNTNPHERKKINRNSDGNNENKEDDVEAEGKIYVKQRDPPGQKCVYIFPGDTEKETYRLSTFFKFPEEAPVDPCFLAKYGFYYTGYKDRVKCFSCGINVTEWQACDNPKDRKWHYKDCLLMLGSESARNVPIIQKAIIFEGSIDPSLSLSGDSGYAGSSSCSSSAGAKQVAMATQNAREIVADAYTKPSVPSSSNSQEPEKILSDGMSVMQIGNDNNNVVVNGHNNVVSIQSESSSVPAARQTAHVQNQKNGAPKVQGLLLATIISSYHQELLTKVLNLHREDDRKKSFFGWALIFSTVTPDTLAKSGFFYLGNSDRVQCFSCSGVLRNWKENDDVDEQHTVHFPHCKMVMRTEFRNVPMPDNLRTIPVRKQAKVVEPANPSPEILASLKRQFPCMYPVNPHMRNIEERLQTFDHRWPKRKINAEIPHIAKAGFYFLGDRDRAKCWYCNGGLQNWEANDEPFTEHAKWFPGCEYILQCKGVDFVKDIVEKFPSLRRPTLSNPRFDHRTGQLIAVNPSPNQQQPVVVDPQENMSAGDVLSGNSPPSLPNGLGNGDSEGFENMAAAMGFDRALAQRVIQRRIQNHGRNFDNIQDLLDVLLNETSTSAHVPPPPVAVPPQEEVETFGPIQGQQAIEVCESSSLKRNNDANEQACSSNEPMEGEAPLKKSKIGLNEELTNLENTRKCKVCFKTTADRVVLPCGHLSLCSNCERKTKACPVCKRRIQTVIKAYVV